MIVPMKKVFLIIRGDQNEQTLKKLRKLGLLHIEISEGSGAEIKELQAQIARLESAIFLVGDKEEPTDAANAATLPEILSAAERILSLAEEKKACQDQLASLTSELERLKAWGEIDPGALSALAVQGVMLTLCELPWSEYRKLGPEVRTLLLKKDGSTVRFLHIRTEKEEESEVAQALQACRIELPKTSTASLKQRHTELQARLEAIAQELSESAGYGKAMKRAIGKIEQQIRFVTYATGMARQNLSADAGGSYTVSYFQGFVEAEKLGVLQAAAKENAWGLAAKDPTEEDNAPTKLKNNKFVSLIYPLTDFLGTVPGYFEYDISAWFLTFILIFFGIIFGDGGYGLLICGIVAVPILKALFAKTPISPAFLLIGLFGLSTILWGTLTCTWFGLSPELLPNWLKCLSIPVLSNVYADKIWYPPWTQEAAGLTTSQNVQILCFTLALVQLSVAHVMCAIRNRKSVKMLGDIGSIFQLLGIYYVVLTLVVNGAVFGLDLVIGDVPIGLSAIALIGVGFVMSFVFSNYEGNLLKSVLSSLKDIVSVLLGVINVFSDIVSYIRLWAVGLAGAAISATVNELVSPFFGNFLFMIVAIVLLVFGHGLNMILNVLSVIVHGIRLNTLEFSSHLNMSWSGHKYDPFRE